MFKMSGRDVELVFSKVSSKDPLTEEACIADVHAFKESVRLVGKKVFAIAKNPQDVIEVRGSRRHFYFLDWY